MDIKFLGRGSAFNTNEGNTAAYFIENKNLFLIDCGESIFARLKELNLLKSVDSVYLFLTHTHPDHAGSVGTLIFYLRYCQKIKLKIVSSHSSKQIRMLEKMLKYSGIEEALYDIVDIKLLDNTYTSFNRIRYTKTNHREHIHAYSIQINTDNGLLFYSGDTNEVLLIDRLIKRNKKIDKLYVDVTNDKSGAAVHLSLKVLNDTLPDYLKEKTYCKHLESDECIVEARKLGFKIVDIV